MCCLSDQSAQLHRLVIKNSKLELVSYVLQIVTLNSKLPCLLSMSNTSLQINVMTMFSPVWVDVPAYTITRWLANFVHKRVLQTRVTWPLRNLQLQFVFSSHFQLSRFEVSGLNRSKCIILHCKRLLKTWCTVLKDVLVAYITDPVMCSFYYRIQYSCYL